MKDLAAGGAAATRTRSLPSSRPFNVAVFFSALYFIGLITSVTAVVMFFRHPTPLIKDIILMGIGFCSGMWLVAFFKRRAAHCPLCKGTPLINTGACPHSRARRLYPLNHGMTTILSIIATQKFRCMYCGSDFDLLKTPSHLRGAKDGEGGS